MGKKLRMRADESREKVKKSLSSILLPQPRPSNDAQLCSISFADPQSMVICACKHCVYMCLFAPMTPLALWAQLPSPQLSILLAPAASPQPLIGPHTAGSCLGQVREPEGAGADTSLLFWLLLTGVNCYHKAWRMAEYVSVVMWACLALRNMEEVFFFLFFLQNDQRFCPINLL